MAAPEQQRMTPAIGVRGWLLALALVTGLPATIFSVFAMLEHARAQIEKTDAQLRQQVLAVASDIDANLSAKVAMLRALAASQDPERADIGQLYHQARGVSRVEAAVQSLALVDREGNRLFSTREPLGAVLPPTGDVESVRRAFDENRPVVSDLYVGAMTRHPVTALGVPVRLGRADRHVLRMFVGVEEYAGLLTGQHLPEGWGATLMDGKGAILARTRAPEIFVGKEVSPWLRSVLHSLEVMESANREGVKVRFAIAPVGDWGWHVLVQVPVATLYASMRVYLLRLAGIGLFCAVCGFAGAWLLSRRLAAEVELAAGASAAPAPDGPPVRPTLVRELRQVGDELAAAREREEMALRDSLTGLPGRTLFLRHARRLLEASRRDPSLRLAVMFIDLDGFKQVNDRHGHAEGDEVLRGTARVLEGAVRPSDAVGRLGGDEFVLCLALRADTACEVARSVAARIVSGVARIGFGIGCSVGISLGRAEGNPEASGDVAEDQPVDGTGGGPDGVPGDRPDGVDRPDEADGPDEEALDGAPTPLRALLEEADKAMYLAKQAGKNSYHLLDLAACD